MISEDELKNQMEQNLRRPQNEDNIKNQTILKMKMTQIL